MYKRFVLFYAEGESPFFCKQLEVSKTLWLSNLFKTSIASWIGLKHSLVNYLCGTWLLLQDYIQTQLYKQRLLTDWLDLADTSVCLNPLTFQITLSPDSLQNNHWRWQECSIVLKTKNVCVVKKMCVSHWRNRDWPSIDTKIMWIAEGVGGSQDGSQRKERPVSLAVLQALCGSSHRECMISNDLPANCEILGFPLCILSQISLGDHFVWVPLSRPRDQDWVWLVIWGGP